MTTTPTPSSDHGDFDSTQEFSRLEDRSEQLRLAAKSSSKNAHLATAVGTFYGLPRMESDLSDPDAYLTWSQNHPGEPPVRQDLVAHNAGWDTFIAFHETNFPNAPRPIDAGEEAGAGTRSLSHEQFILRQDALDGSKLWEDLTTNWSAVALIDQVRFHRGVPRVRHWAGAIALSTGSIVSWTNLSNYDHDAAGYRRVRGRVYLDASIFGAAEFEITEPRWDRTSGSIAIGAYKRQRFVEFAKSIDLDQSGNVYNMAGTPLVLGLLVGKVEAVLDRGPWSTLHDTAHLLPHQILNGKIFTSAGEPMNYLHLYEENAGTFNPGHKPIPGYVAAAGTSDASRYFLSE